ncbi:hypothetical protein [Dapis sp. BLCC M229]|uniref:hypothetical protein n=1 Tax=Dapis sp. BLCC M229 TaxID=3400188 RepID=UPI003CF02666
MQPLSQEQIELLNKQVIETFVKTVNTTFIVAVVISQAGIAKSSLINVVFNINQSTNLVKPCTMTVEKVVMKRNKRELWYYNLPKIEESESAYTR